MARLSSLPAAAWRHPCAIHAAKYWSTTGEQYLVTAQCQQQANLIALVVFVAYVAISTTSVLAFYGWRRSTPPWRTLSFVVFAVCALLLIDTFMYALSYSFVPTTASAATTCH